MSTGSGDPPSSVPEKEAYMPTNLGELISTLYDEFLTQYGDEELASVATAAVINDFLSGTEAVS
jgi:hypothetical protein